MKPLALVLLGAIVLGACRDDAPKEARSEPTTTVAPATTTTTTTMTEAEPGAVVLAAGDIGQCSSPGDEAVAALLDHRSGEILALGDEAYPSGRTADFANCYGSSWGRHKARTHPVPGNHDVASASGDAYYGYFGAAAGRRGEGWYSWDLGGWHLVALNSNCAAAGGCGAGSAQERWLRADLAAHPSACTLAYWHHPRFSSGGHGSSTATAALWQALDDAGADVVLAGHDHDYERLAPVDPAGGREDGGMRSFVVGTGGAFPTPFRTPLATSESRATLAWGVLQLTLRQSSYEWRFLPAPPTTFTDSGSGRCR